MKKPVKIIFLAALMLLSLVGCSAASGNNGTTAPASDADTTASADEVKYGEDDNGAGIYPPLIQCGKKLYLLGQGTGELPEGSEFLGTSSSESTTEVLDGHKITGVTVIEQSVFSDTMYATTIEPGSEFYISADKKTIYCQCSTGTYDAYVMQ